MIEVIIKLMTEKNMSKVVRIASLARLPGDTLDRIKMGMVVCFEGQGGIICKRIQKYQKAIGFSDEAAAITHVAISIGGPYVVESTFPRSRCANMLEDYQGRKLIFLYMWDKDFRREKRKNVAVWAATRCNLRYGWWGLIGFYVSHIWPFGKRNILSSNKQPFCSYLLAWAFRRAGYDPFPGVASDLVTPAHFYESAEFEKVKVNLHNSVE